MNVRLSGEGALVVASQHVERDARDEVAGGVERDVARVLALALVGEAAVERVRRGADGAVDGHGELEVDGQGEADDVEARADVGGRRRRADREGFLGRHFRFWRGIRAGWWSLEIVSRRA